MTIVARILPHDFAPGALPPDADQRPHLHIGLVAMTWLIDGRRPTKGAR